MDNLYLLTDEGDTIRVADECYQRGSVVMAIPDTPTIQEAYSECAECLQGLVGIETDVNQLSVMESSQAFFQVRLTRKPYYPVMVHVERISGDVDLNIIGVRYLHFDQENYGEYQTVIIQAELDLDPSPGQAVFRCSSEGLPGVYADVTVTEDDIDILNISVSATAVSIPEGGTATFQVRVTAMPLEDLVVSVFRYSGDTDITVQSGSSLTFTSVNWNVYQTVTLAAAEDPDAGSGTAIIRCSSPGVTDKDITATEVENDTTLTVAANTGGTTNPSGAVVVTKNVARAIAATANTNYYFKQWAATSGSPAIANVYNASTTATISAPGTVTANFVSNYYGNGSDGDATISGANTVLNTSTDLTADIASGATTITVRSTTGFTAGKSIIIHQTQSYRPSDAASGRWEIRTINTIVNSTSLTVTSGVSRAYYSDSDGNKQRSTKAQIILLKQYKTLTISGSITCSAFDGYSKGIVAISCWNLAGAGAIHANAKGFRGTTMGEGWRGIGDGTVVSNGIKGGGGFDQTGGGNNQTGGGGGHLNNGTFGSAANTYGGTAYGITEANVYTQPMPGGGGSGLNNPGYSGGAGGGIILLMVNNPASYTGSLSSTGGNGAGGDYNCGGGGGAGGSIAVFTPSSFSRTMTVTGGLRYDGGPAGAGSVGRKLVRIQA
jgi:hypothetical protein